MSWAIGLVDFSAKSEVQSDGRCASSYMRKYLVRSNSPTFLEEPIVAAAVGITRGSPLSIDVNAICQSVSITPGPTMTRAPFQAWFATYEFATTAPLPGDDNDDPLTTRTVWSINPQIQSRYVIKDRLGNLIVNTAGSPFDGGIPVDVRLGSVTARRNISADGYDLSTAMTVSGAVNSTTYLGGAPGTVQVDLSASEKYEGGYHFWEETYTFSFDPKGWQPQPISAGFFQKDGSVLKRILNSDLGDTNDPDAPVQEPEPLDGAGHLVPVASRPGGCVFVTVDFFPAADFNMLGLI
jgi:hypothetical protein